MTTIPARSSAVPPEKPLCFVVSPIGAEDSDIRKTADKVLKHVITKALDAEYQIKRADEIGKPGLITAEIVRLLFEAPLVIADLTSGNANVYYELAIRHVTHKPVIHIIKAGQDAPFDVKDMAFIPYEITDPDSIDSAQKKIREQADAIKKGEKFMTPVQVGQILARPPAEEDAKEALLKAMYVAIANLQQEVRATNQGLWVVGNQVLSDKDTFVVNQGHVVPLSLMKQNWHKLGQKVADSNEAIHNALKQQDSTAPESASLRRRNRTVKAAVRPDPLR
jgi:hypothetical protein